MSTDAKIIVFLLLAGACAVAAIIDLSRELRETFEDDETEEEDDW